ncbi:HAD-IB family phosphatase [Desulfosarcina sp. OttesenSCG-928-A07]|nr:HAD-IB family phosphatase [Desulfosarcina sp. OttesenSCG-928-G17]MDL2330003.1 HAD-IB family phosphatase [Desulfosarcina sp. OttesenSCG-928-A07]
MADPKQVLVTDFDGTITAHDFYLLAVQRLLSPEALTPWNDCLAGKIPHFTALQRIFRQIRAPESVVLELLQAMRPDPHLADALSALKNAGWHVVVASAGCQWYICRILDDLGIQLEVHANPGVYREGGPLEMEPPVNSPFYSPETGVDKAGIVRFYQKKDATVAYAGDGYADLPAALLVPSAYRFARAELASLLSQQKQKFIPFTVWSDVARHLLSPVAVGLG